MAASTYQLFKLQLFQANRNLRTGAAQEPAAVSSPASFQVHPAGKLLFRSKLHRVSDGPLSKVPQTRPILPITCFSYKFKTDVAISERPFLLPSSRYVHRQKSTFSLNSATHGNVQSSLETSTWKEEGHATDDSGKKKEVETMGAAEPHVAKAAPAKHWLQSYIPASLWPYAQLTRVQRPDGAWFVAWPCLWSICLAAPLGTFPHWKTVGLFSFWAFFLRSSACTLNDILDRDLDAQVERTRSRPLPSGAATVPEAIVLFAFLSSVTLAITLWLNDLSRLLGAIDLVLFAVYPLMKRVTYWPQAFLGFVGNWGQLVGWSAIRGNLDLSIILPLYASGALWWMIFDTIYAHQDKKDDVKAGVKSTAVLFGDQTKIILSAFCLGSVALLGLAGFRCGLGWPFYVGVVVAAGHLTWQLSSVNLDDPVDCGVKFRSNVWYGGIVFSAILLGNLYA